MERLDIICVGSIKEKFLRELFAEYEKRLSRFCKLTVTELKEVRIGDNPSQSEIDAVLESEADMILSKVPQGAYIIAMCIEGKMQSSEEFAKTLEVGFAKSGKTAIIIGSSHGLAQKVKTAADIRFSMSPMTFPHQLARCIIAEQVYRAYKIRNKESYHK